MKKKTPAKTGSVSRTQKIDPTKRVEIGELSRAVDEKLAHALNAFDEEVITQLVRDKPDKGVVTIGILTDKKLLLENRPTQIISVQDRTTLADLYQMLMKEAARRNLEIDLTQNPNTLPLPVVREIEADVHEPLQNEAEKKLERHMPEEGR